MATKDRDADERDDDDAAAPGAADDAYEDDDGEYEDDDAEYDDDDDDEYDDDEYDDDEDDDASDDADGDDADGDDADGDDADGDDADGDDADGDDADGDDADGDDADGDDADGDDADGDDADGDDADGDDADGDELDADGRDGTGAAGKKKRARTDDARSASVAKALGVGDEDDEDADGDDDADAPTNRAERRRQRARRRRAKRKGRDDVAPAAPRDKNARTRDELLKRRRQAAAADDDEDDEPLEALTAGEMMDDALARGGAAFVKWAQRNGGTIGIGVLVAILGTAGILYYTYRQGEVTAAGADALAHGVNAEMGVIIAEADDTRSEEDKKNDVRSVYRTAAEQQQAALDAYKKVDAEHAGTGAAILAKLGQANVLLDQREWDAAIAGFEAVLKTALAEADPDVKARALEGIGFAQEGKDDLEAALTTYEKLGASSETGFKLLAQLHRGRILLRKGDKDKATEVLKAARTQAEEANIRAAKIPNAPKPYTWLEEAIEEDLRRIDPNLAPKAPAGGMDPEKLRELLRQQGIDPDNLPGKAGK